MSNYRTTCYMECWFYANTWDDTDHGHRHIYVENVRQLPIRFEEDSRTVVPWGEQNRIRPVYREPVIRGGQLEFDFGEMDNDPLAKAIKQFYETSSRPYKSITKVEFKVRLGPYKNLFVVLYYPKDWKPEIEVS